MSQPSNLIPISTSQEITPILESNDQPSNNHVETSQENVLATFTQAQLESVKNLRVAKWVYAQYYILQSFKLQEGIPDIPDLELVAHTSWDLLPHSRRMIYMKLAAVSRYTHYYYHQQSVEILPRTDINTWKLRITRFLNPQLDNEHPLQQIDTYLEQSFHNDSPFNAHLNKLNILEHKRFYAQVIENDLNSIGIKLIIDQNQWVLLLQNSHLNTFMATNYFQELLRQHIQTTIHYLQRKH